MISRISNVLIFMTHILLSFDISYYTPYCSICQHILLNNIIFFDIISINKRRE
nr:MAG TPA: KaiB domain [Caudoviricetes sp.]